MKRFGIILIVLAVFINFSFISAKGTKIGKLKFPELAKIQKPRIGKYDLKNGIRLRVIEDDKFPIVNLSVWIKGGDVFEPGSKIGLASITAQLLRIGGTKNFSGEELDRKLDSRGISISIGSRFDYFIVNVSSLKDNFNEAIDILSEILMFPAFNKDKFKEIKVQMSSSVSRKNDEPSSITIREFDKLIYGGDTPFGTSMEYEHLDNIKPADVRAYYEKFFAPSNLLIGITGPVKLKEAESIIENSLGKWTGKANIPKYPEVKKINHDFKIAFAEKSGMNQSQISIGHLGVKESIEQKAKILVFNSIFSQGFNSRLMRRLRVKMGLTYGIGGGIISRYLYPGKVYFSTFTKSETTTKAIEAIFDEIKKIQTEKVTLQELKDAKDYFINSYVFKFSSPEKVLGNYLNEEFYGLDSEKYDNLITKIKTVTAEEVYDVANKYMNPDKMVVLIVGSKKKIKGKLSDIGKVKEIDISIKPPKMKEVIPEATQASLKKGKSVVFSALNKNYSGYKRVKSTLRIFDMKLKLQGRELSFFTKTTTVYPDKVYNETNVMGMKIVKVINGNKGFIEQMGQKKEITKKEIDKDRFGSIYDIYRFPKQYSFQYLGEKKIKNKLFDQVYVFNKNKNWVKFYINKKTGLIEIQEKIEKIAGREGIARIENSDFNRYGDIMVPGKVTIFLKGEKMIEIMLKDFKTNLKVDRSLFKIN